VKPHGSPVLPAEVTDRVLRKLEVTAPSSPDLAALNALYAAWSCRVPFDNVQKCIWFAGDQAKPVTGGEPVDHAFFLERYAASTCSGPFNHGLYVCRRFLDSIVSIGRNKKFTVSQDGQQTVTEFSGEDRRRVLIDELGFSEEIVSQLGQSATP